MHKVVLVVVSAVFWFTGLFVPIQSPAGIYIPVNVILPILGTLALFPVFIRKR